MTVGLFPHGAGLADVVAEAERLDLPVRVVDGAAGRTAAAARRSSTVTGAGVEVDAVKPPTTAPATWSCASTRRAATGPRSPSPPTGRIIAASRCNLLEEPAGSFEVSDGIVALTLRPFELVTLRLTR